VPKTLNLIKNAAFAEGKTKPLRWQLPETGDGVRLDRSDANDGITVHVSEAVASAVLSQTVVCKPGEHYRVEAVISGDVRPAKPGGGIVVRAQPVAPNGTPGEREMTPPVTKSREPFRTGGFLEIPEGVRRLKVDVGIIDAAGTATIHQVLVMGVIERDEESHLLALPEPAHAMPAPRAAERVAACANAASQRPLTAILKQMLGPGRVSAVAPASLEPRKLDADALLLPDDLPPRAIRSVASLLKLAEERVVVLSLGSFVKLAGGALRIRTVEQEDDPIFARVVFANYATSGLALHDAFPFAADGAKPGSFKQRHLRTGNDLDNFCGRHGLTPLLHSLCNQDSTSEKPVALFRTTARGGLFVIDLDPIEAEPTCAGGPTIAVHLLRNILGLGHGSLGQYASPVQEEHEFRSLLPEMQVRFPEFVVHAEDVPATQLEHQLVTVGNEDAGFGLPLRPKPVVLVRSGLRSGDAESVYGTFQWFKQLVRMPPHCCPYAHDLASRLRFAWVPLAAGWDLREGWRRGNRPPESAMTIDADDSKLSAVIDVASEPVNRARVVVPAKRRPYERYMRWIPSLFDTFTIGDYFAFAPPDGARFDDRTQYAWRSMPQSVTVEVDPSPFDSPFHRQAQAGGAELIRIEVPGHDADFPSHSIYRTDLAATLLEWVIGLQFGLIAVNRTHHPVRFDGFEPLEPGQAVVVEAEDALLRGSTARAV